MLLFPYDKTATWAGRVVMVLCMASWLLSQNVQGPCRDHGWSCHIWWWQQRLGERFGHKSVLCAMMLCWCLNNFFGWSAYSLKHLSQQRTLVEYHEARTIPCNPNSTGATFWGTLWIFRVKSSPWSCLKTALRALPVEQIKIRLWNIPGK